MRSREKSPTRCESGLGRKLFRETNPRTTGARASAEGRRRRFAVKLCRVGGLLEVALDRVCVADVRFVGVRAGVPKSRVSFDYADESAGAG